MPVYPTPRLNRQSPGLDVNGHSMVKSTKNFLVIIFTMSPEQLWQAALGQLELSLSKPNFTTWFKNTSLLSLESGKAVVSVPNTFTKAWFEKKYHRVLVETLQQITAQPVREIFYQVGARPVAATPPAASRESSFSSPSACFTPLTHSEAPNWR